MRHHRIVAMIVAIACLPSALTAESPQQWVKANLDDLVTLYRHFHSHPELSFEEKETAARLAEEWRILGAEVTSGIGGHGVVGFTP